MRIRVIPFDIDVAQCLSIGFHLPSIGGLSQLKNLHQVSPPITSILAIPINALGHTLLQVDMLRPAKAFKVGKVHTDTSVLKVTAGNFVHVILDINPFRLNAILVADNRLDHGGAKIVVAGQVV